MIEDSPNFILDEARVILFKDADLIVQCRNNEKMAISRLLFGLLLKTELRNELFTSGEDSCLILEDIETNELRTMLENAFFHSGTVPSKIMKRFDFINWDLFKGSQEAKAITNRKENVKCPVCGKMLSDKKNLKKHADVVHFNIRNHNCDTCGKRFISRNDLLDHARAVHEKIRAFICDICGQALSTRHGLRMHKLIHKEGSKSISCSRCDKTFRHLSTYRKHIARVHEFTPDKRLKCETCGKLFNHTEGVKRHVKKFHSLQKPDFQCDLCPSAFIFKYDLNKHKKRAHENLAQEKASDIG